MGATLSEKTLRTSEKIALACGDERTLAAIRELRARHKCDTRFVGIVREHNRNVQGPASARRDKDLPDP